MSTMFVKFDKDKNKRGAKKQPSHHPGAKERSESLASLDALAKTQNQSRVSIGPIVHSPDFNLRAYLETHGYNLEAVKSYIRVEDSTIRGYLQKLSHRWKVWNRRWFVFDWRAGTLIYYKTNKEHGAAQVIPFRHIMGVSTDSLSKSEPKFCLKTSQKTYVLLAPSADVLRVWVDSLAIVIEAKDK